MQVFQETQDLYRQQIIQCAPCRRKQDLVGEHFQNFILTPVLNLANLSRMEDVMEMAIDLTPRLNVWQLVEVSNRCVTLLVIIH